MQVAGHKVVDPPQGQCTMKSQAIEKAKLNVMQKPVQFNELTTAMESQTASAMKISLLDLLRRLRTPSVALDP